MSETRDRELVALPHFTCPLCGEDNACDAARTGRLDVECWCASVTIEPVALARAQAVAPRTACLCRWCATGAGAVALVQPMRIGQEAEGESK